MPKISIILPCYNVEAYLAKSIESVLVQIYNDFELLVVIDGSPDNSREIAEQFAKTDSRIKVYEKENGGLSDARNYGLERANGEFIYFMDSDDWIEPKLLEDNLKIVEQENLDFVIFGYIQDNEDTIGNIQSSKDIIPKVKQYVKADKQLTIDTHHLGLMGYAWNKIYRKSFLDQHQFRFKKGISLVEDILFNAPIYQISNRIVFNQQTYYHYINRPVMTLMKQFHLNSFELIKMKINVLEGFTKEWQMSNSNNILAVALVQGIRYCIHNLFSFKNQLNFNEKIDFIKVMVSDQLTRKKINQYNAISLADKLYKFCIKNKLVSLIVLFALTKK